MILQCDMCHKSKEDESINAIILCPVFRFYPNYLYLQTCWFCSGQTNQFKGTRSILQSKARILKVCSPGQELLHSSGSLLEMQNLARSGLVSTWMERCMHVHLLALREASCNVLSCPKERLMLQKTMGGPQPTASKELRPSVQQPTRNWTLPTSI